MTLSSLLTEIKAYLHVEGTSAESILKTFINDSIRDFIRFYDWEKLKVIDDITTDGSDEYTLDDTNLSSVFEREIALIIPYAADTSSSIQKTQYSKYDYYNYLQLTSKDYAWSVFGTKLYIAGSGATFKFLYMSPGDSDNWPLADNADEVPAIIYYPDVIEKMAVVKFLDYIGEDTSKENELLGIKMAEIKSAQNRAANSGKTPMIQRGGLGSSGV